MSAGPPDETFSWRRIAVPAFGPTLLSAGAMGAVMPVAALRADELGADLGTAAFVAFLSKLCDRTYTATQYALLTALASIVRTVLSSFTGILAEEVGWVAYFGITFFAAVPGLMLLALLMRIAFDEDDEEDKQSQEPAPTA